MKVFGCLKKDGNDFDFYLNHGTNNSIINSETHTFSDNKIFLYIDGAVSKLSNKACRISDSFGTINERIAYLHSINFDLESHICGSFNIFLYDYKRHELKIVRDTRGTRSLFYVNNEREFIFSSDQSSIIKKIQKVSLNKNKLIEFLNWDYKLNGETYFQEIYQIKPYHQLIYFNKELNISRYKLSQDLIDLGESKSYLKTFKNLLYESVVNIINPDKRIGVMMSGGLDSSAIAIALKENNFTNVRTYSANFDHISDSHNLDETDYQKNISDLTSYNHSFIQMKDKSPIRSIQKFTMIFNKPILFPNIYLFEEITKKLKDDKIEIILDGNDGDNTVSHGFEVIFFYFTKLRLIKFVKEIYLYSRFKKTSFLRFLRIFIVQAIKEIFNIKEQNNKNSILKKSLMVSKNPKNINSFFSSHKKKLSNDLIYLGNEYRSDLFKYYGIENFSPFYDEILINFCINMPNEKKLHDGYTRKILREFLSEFLPQDHANRDKSILTSGLIENFKGLDLSIVESEFKKINITLEGLVDLGKLQKIINNLRNGKRIEEQELIDLQIFVSANTFMNQHNF